MFRTFDQFLFFGPTQESQEPRTVQISKVIGPDRQLCKFKSDPDFLFLLTDSSFLVVDIESEEVVFERDVSDRQVLDFFVSPGEDFYVLLMANDPKQNLVVIIQAEEQSPFCKAATQNSLGSLTCKFFIEKRFSLGEYKVFGEPEAGESPLVQSSSNFQTSEKRVREVFFDDSLRGLFYVQYCDHTLEGYVLRREFDHSLFVSRVGEIDFHSSQKESVLLRVESELELLSVDGGQLFLFDRRNDQTVGPVQSEAHGSSNEATFSIEENADVLFSVAGPGFENLKLKNSSDPESRFGCKANFSLSPEARKSLVRQMLSLNLLQQSLEFTRKMGDTALAQEIGTAAIKAGDTDLAIECFQLVGNVSMVLSLKKLQRRAPDSLGYLGELALILCDYSRALRLYFLDKNFSKVIFLCDELKALDLGLDLLRFVQTHSDFGRLC